MEKGWIKLHRSIIDWEWYDDDKTFKFFIGILCLCNYEKKDWMGKTIEEGSFVTSYDKLSDRLNVKKITVRRILKKLEETGELKVENLHKLGIKITIVKYKNYQNEHVNEHVNEHSNEHSNERQLKKEKNKRKKRTTGGTNPPAVSLPEELSFSSPEGSQIEQKIDSLSRWERVLSVWKSTEPDYVLKATRDKYWMKKGKEFQEEMVKYLESLGPKAIHLQTLWIGPMFKNNLFHPGQIQTEIDKKESQTKKQPAVQKTGFGLNNY